MPRKGWRRPPSEQRVDPASSRDFNVEYVKMKQRESGRELEVLADQKYQKAMELSEMLKTLRAFGVRQDDLMVTTKDATLIEGVAEAFKKWRFLSEPEEVIKTFLEVNERVWKDPNVTAEAIERLGPPPVVPVSDECGLYAPVLLRDTGNFQETLSQNLDAFRYVFGEDVSDLYDIDWTDKEVVRLSPKARPRSAGLRWEIVELGRGTWGSYPPHIQDVFAQQGITGIGQEIPLIAAEHKRWAKTLGAQKQPCLAAIDLEACLDRYGDYWGTSIQLYRDTGDDKVGFGTFGAGLFSSGPCAGFGSFRRAPIDWVAYYESLPSKGR